jgi:general secretion pathway protein D
MNKHPLFCLGLLLGAFGTLTTPALKAQTPSSGLVDDSERAIVRSQEDLLRARSLMARAMKLRDEKNLQGAWQLSSESLTLTPTGISAQAERKSIVTSYTTISLEYAQQLVNNGIYTDQIAERSALRDDKGQPVSAESVAKSILKPSVNPGSVEAKQFLSDLEQPAIFNKTMTPKAAAQRDEVTRLLTEAEGYAQSGRNDLAMKRYEAVLTFDPYNTAARKGMEELHSAGLKYADEAYNETRSRLLWQVEKAWERPPRKEKQGRSTESTGRQLEQRGTDQIIEKLRSIMIDRIDLSDSPISEAVTYLTQKSATSDPNKKGINIIYLNKNTPTPASSTTQVVPSSLIPTATAPSQLAPSTEPHLTLSLNHIPLYVALDYISKLANMKLKIEPSAVSIVPLSEQTDAIIKKEYEVPPDFIQSTPIDSAGTLPQAGTTGGVPDPNKSRVGQKMDAKEFLLSKGVEFPPGSGASYRSAGSRLIVRNTQDNIDVIDSIVDAALSQAPTQVDIQTKFLEINQNNLQELGFDWLLGPFSVGGGVYGSGGGNATNVSGANYPFGNPMAGGAPMSPIGGIRSGDQAISANSIDALIAGQNGLSTAPAPGIFSIAGVFSEPQFQLVIRALNQKKGVDLMSAPKVTIKSGGNGKIRIVDEFIYPRSYQPPQVPQSTANTGITTTGNNASSIGNQTPPTITPSFPTDFTKQDLGVTLDVKPTIAADGYTIEMDLNPKVTDFDGFINYGSPINAVGYSRTLNSGGLTLTPTVQTLTTNTINQPVFSTREVITSVIVWDGQTVALGGLIREDVQKVQDKVPFLGDVPLAGRLFRSEADHKFKKNLVIFVTPRILDPDGQQRRGDTEEPEIVTPIGLPEDLPSPTTSSAAKGK